MNFMQFSNTDSMLGADLMKQETGVSDWIKKSVMPKAREDVKPLLDIYAEVLEIKETMSRIEIELILIREALEDRWYKKLWAWLTRNFRENN